MPYMTALKPALIRFGLGPYLEEVPGWETRGSASFAPACTIGHHTAGPLSGDRPSLNICVNGRADLPGPLCNDFLSRSKVVLVAAGRANHAGTGGFRGLVGNSAAFGNEAESTGVLRRDGSPDWSEFQRWAFPRVHAAHLWLLGRDASWYLGHRDWTSRKVDPTAIETAAMRREIAAILANPSVQEDDMFDPNTHGKQLEAIARFVEWYGVPDDQPDPNSKGELTKRIRGIHATVAALAARDPKVTIDAEAIAAAIPDDLAEQVVARLAEKLAARPAA